MIADVVLGIWLIMAAVYGWKRKALLEFNSLLIFVVSYAIARIASVSLAPIVESSLGWGPIGTQVVISFVLCIVLYIVLGMIWKKVRPIGSESGLRIELDAQGNPIVKGVKLKALLGAVFGILRGALMYVAVLHWLMLLVPIVSYNDGKGLTVVHPASYTIQTLRKLDPLLQRIDWTVKGLRTLRYTQHSRKARRKVYKDKTLRKWMRTKAGRRIQRNKTMLNRANSTKQGRRESTLLLWMKDFQQVVNDPHHSHMLQRIAHLVPAPFDHKKRQAKVRKKRRIRIPK